ncbi:MAG TPA: bifunctional hydroxymethylpyrimidine kinase/phosphomethylpyrimidine kinase [Candidatus Aphodovivens excrementavium]|nr:bifunctional hydroxymethylpyrimidine kinase/phosphomethylpyrimidine kinase [Candidatus Aphodovivens excrementavium]
MKAVLSIAGSDSSGGAGIQADIKTISAFGLFGETAITALTAQNTLGVEGVLEATPEFVAQQIDMVFKDIPPAAVKIGMVSSPAIIEAIAGRLSEHQAQNVVVDPVMVATSGSRLIATEAVDALVGRLFPLARVITPNLPEAEVLSGMAISDDESMLQAGRHILSRLTRQGERAVLVKGGHGTDAADDLLVCSDGSFRWFRASRIATDNTHGTGCTLSSAIACGLAMGKPLDQAVGDAKAYVRGALSAGLDLGRGAGPLDHMWRFRSELGVL